MMRPLLRTFVLPGAFLFACVLGSCQTPATDEVAAGSAVVETMNSGGYSYVKLNSDDGANWYAVPECEVAVGDLVEIEPGAMTMQNFKSSTLNRTFPVIYFASGLQKVGKVSG